MTNGKYKSLANFYKFGFGRYPGFTRSTNLVGGITDIRQFLGCVRRVGNSWVWRTPRPYMHDSRLNRTKVTIETRQQSSQHAKACSLRQLSLSVGNDVSEISRRDWPMEDQSQITAGVVSFGYFVNHLAATTS